MCVSVTGLSLSQGRGHFLRRLMMDFPERKRKGLPLSAGVKVNTITDALRREACWESFCKKGSWNVSAVSLGRNDCGEG